MNKLTMVTNLMVGTTLLLGTSSAFATASDTTCESAGVNCDKVSVETIDLLALYDQNAVRVEGSERFLQAKLKGWEEDINSFYKNSGVGLKLRILSKELYNSTGKTAEELLDEISSNDYISQRRDALGADFVTLLESVDPGNSALVTCGVGYVTINPKRAFSVVGSGCGSLSLAHEMGHNMGLSHSRKQGDTSGTRYKYALGYGVENKFSTIMAYPQSYNTKNQIGVFSNPNLTCAGYPCGVPVNEPDSAYATLAINNVRKEISNFMPTKM